VRVRTGERVGDVVEVLRGVKAGDSVVVQGAGFLGDGDRVRVVASAGGGARAMNFPPGPSAGRCRR
jgi:acyl-[acyl carrier protein]--UDP-N-acetylglucosamine O-acyltransferase